MIGDAQNPRFAGECPYCHSTHRQVRNGKQRSGSIKVKCRLCGKAYTLHRKRRGHPVFVVYAALSFYRTKRSYREVASICGVHHQTVINWVKRYPYGIYLTLEDAWCLRLDEKLGQFFSSPVDTTKRYWSPALRITSSPFWRPAKVAKLDH